MPKPIIRFTTLPNKMVQVRVNGRLVTVLRKKTPGFPSSLFSKTPYWSGSLSEQVRMGGAIHERSLVAAKQAVRDCVRKNSRAFAKTI